MCVEAIYSVSAFMVAEGSNWRRLSKINGNIDVLAHVWNICLMERGGHITTSIVSGIKKNNRWSAAREVAWNL